MAKIIYFIWIVLTTCFMTSCEDLGDTYDSTKGKIRYLGKCSNVVLSPGWNRLSISWANSVDPMIDKIKITWKCEDVAMDTLLDKAATTCDLKNLPNGNYEVSVYGVDKEGNVSLSSTVYGRPYTEEHEIIRVFTRGITKYFKVKNNLILFYDKWQDNVVSLVLNYYGVDGNHYKMELTEDVLYKEYDILKDVNTELPITIDRMGKIEGCEDLIVFKPYKLEFNKSFSTDFKVLLETRYGVKDVDDDFLNSITELEIDNSITSFDDILYFPNLKRVILGKNRFFSSEYLASSEGQKNVGISTVSEKYRSLFVLETAHELCGLEIERYNEHFFPKKRLDYMHEMGNPSVPQLPYLYTADWTITSSIEDSYNANLSYLLDDDPNTFWQTGIESVARRYELIVDMQEMQRINGFKVVQKLFYNDQISKDLLPGLIQIRVSKDKIQWENATYVENNILGRTNGEVTILNMKEPQEVRYVKIILNDQIHDKNFAVALGDFIPF